ncbi:silent information regulator protein Sir2 [Clostridium novyi A str. 4552]|uniref:Silent information regulator protein Sir2 n=1 Tax=Clostridium novyi A str. 4552 TaxID=1444289 RepID=A0A0A0I509_CLONO|nr:polysaccharide lyase 8 family protein [Clostridium novyi]KGM94720.1 silent information regulator protein Sir2 [Clostridium novyi A str. 4552]
MNKKKIILFLTSVLFSSCIFFSKFTTCYGFENHVTLNTQLSQQVLTKSNILDSLIPKENFLIIEKNSTMQLPINSKYIKNTIYQSYNSDILSVTNSGLIKGLQKGCVIVSATTPKNTTYYLVTVKYTNTPPKISKKEYSTLRKKWATSITGINQDKNDSNINHLVQSLNENAQKYMNSINKDSSKKYLWDDIQDLSSLTPTQRSANIVSNYKRILTMTKAYVLPGSLNQNPNLLNSILYSLDWMYKNKYNSNLNTEYGNWWSWEIGTPKTLIDICILLHDNLDSNRLKNYMNAIYFYQPDPFHSGYTKLHPNPYRESQAANRVDVAKIALGLGILSENSEQVLMSKDALESLLNYVNNGDGFYTDGSFIQHGSVPYVGTYGNVFISGLLEANSILKDSTCQINKDKIKILYDFIKDSFEPFLYRGAALDMVRGRAISRYNYNDRASGHDIINSLLILCHSADEPYLSHFKSLTKYLLQSDTLYNHLKNQSSINMINDAKNLLNDSSVKPLSEKSYHKNFPIMDRVIHKRSGYLFGVSMFSSRISNYESMNNENRKGWHTNAGMTYLYNNDLSQYSENFWPTINPYRIPGTTIDTIKMEPSKACAILSQKDWVGGVTLGNYGINGMEFQGISPYAKSIPLSSKNFLSLNGKKSWFMFDKEIVCLGSDINSSDNRIIETIIENRKLKKDNTNVFNTNLGTFNAANNNTKILKNISWGHLSGNTPNSNIGYYFPDKTSINVKRSLNNGIWANIGSNSPKDTLGNPLILKENFLEMWINHGKNPKKASYAYVLLPNISLDALKNYNANPKINILRNDKSVQAVKHTDLNMICANTFSSNNETIDCISLNSKASVILKENKNDIEIAISDPTMKNSGFIDLTLNKNIKGTIHMDKGMSIISTSNSKGKIRISVSNSKGKTFYAKLKK